MAGSSSGWEDGLAGSFVGLFILLAIVALIALIWLSVRVLNCVVNGFALAPRSKALWLSLAASLVFLLVALVTGAGWLLVVAALSFLSLLICAKAIALTHKPLFLREPSREELLSGVIHVDQWWQT